MEDIKTSLYEINKYLNKFEWMDFSYEIIDEECIKIIGSLDLSWEGYHSIELLFMEPINILTLLSEWHKPEERDFIELAGEEEAKNRLIYIGEGNYHVFKINADAYPVAPILIVAKSIKYRILKE